MEQGPDNQGHLHVYATILFVVAPKQQFNASTPYMYSDGSKQTVIKIIMA